MSKINQKEYEVLKELDDKWKYLARNNMYGAKLEAHTSRPYKMTDSHWSNGDMTLELLGGEHLFQFIQWEDEDPYNIAELIEEYKIKELRLAPLRTVIIDSFDESEETEVKDKIWLKDSITKEMQDLFSTTNPNYFDFEYTNKKIRGLVNQLDEPETLSEDWIQEHSYNVHLLGTPDVTTVAVPREDLQNLLVPKQELPVIPKFVADWIESRKNNYPSDVIGVYLRMNELSANEQTREVLRWVHESKLNRGSFARAWLDGYEIEQEPRYYAKIKGHENIGSNDKYWNYNTDMEELSIGDSEVHPNVISEYMLKATKDEWANLGINDDNAEFELVEELEE